MANLLWGEGVASIYIPIYYCPVCGRKLGKQNDELTEGNQNE